ncbi:CRISPR-associated protein Cas5 [Listeria booriae]|uniref:CRISPR-associated protein Cas5 n=1 Tax=Listeria booriae TaxID=1552123 RepID=A0A7X1CJZ2_9LIST|nr:CRISPR-associated protein Cas5 [Listeria booriae]MBC1563631.1 CRISPR-associated protein Cas5 [Listeria booriae]MBC1780567.1 CRISPR-associated protein Cas5 [Listeria booriae]
MKAVKIKINQDAANYKVPHSFQKKESYPLPPFSTVIGMVHVAAGFKEYHPMQVSVAGTSFSSVDDMYNRYEFSNGVKFDPKRHQMKAWSPTRKKYIGITRGIASINLLTDIDLTLHIIPDKSDELETIFEALKNPTQFLSLGRHEDIIRIENVSIVELREVTLEVEHDAKQAIWSPIENGFGGTTYNLNKNYILINVGAGVVHREFFKKLVAYVGVGFTFPVGTKLLFDSDGDIVFPV